MKNLIIVGASRSGKSTVAKKIALKYGISYIPFDVIVSTLENLYPKVGIKHLDENKEMSKHISFFLKEFINHLEYEDINYVIDLYQIYPCDLYNLVDLDKHLVVYFGYPNISPEEKLITIKKYAREKDWTKNTPDKEMIKILNLFINENRQMYKECLEYEIKFFDTGKDFEETVGRAELFINASIDK